MYVWRLCLPKKKKVVLTAKMAEAYKIQTRFLTYGPRFGLVEKAYNLAKDEPLESWVTLAVLGRFYAKYTERFRRTPVHHGHELTNMFREMEILAKRQGTKDLCLGIDALFRDLKWVSGGHMPFLMNRANWDKFLVPAIVTHEEKAGVGEQAEFRGGEAARTTMECEELKL